MSFVQAGFLIGGLAVAIPVLVHLLTRWQVQRVELGTMRFLQEVIRDGSQRRKIRQWFLMMTRMALVALLVLLFARPFLPETVRRDGNRLRIILIDRSASMGMPGKNGRLIDDAVAQASEIAKELGNDATIQGAWFDRNVTPLDESVAGVSAPRAVVGDTDYLAALNWARDQVVADSDAIADVILITDLQQTGMASETIESAGLAFPKDVPIRLVDVGRPAANNLAVRSIGTGSKRISPRREARVDVTLFNYGTLPMEEVPLTATATDGRRSMRLKKSINIPGGQAQEVSFDLGQLDPGVWQVVVGVDVEDDLASDNRRMTAFEVAEPANVRIIDGSDTEDEAASESFYIVSALQQSRRGESELYDELDLDAQEASGPKDGLFAPNVARLIEDETPDLEPNETSLVVVSDSASVTLKNIDQLDRFVRLGGKLLVFAGDGDGDAPLQRVHSAWEQSGLAPGKLKSPSRSGAMPYRITSAEVKRAMLRPFEDPQQGDLARLNFDQILVAEPGEDTNVLARFDSGRPAVTSHAHGNGRVVWFLSSADTSWSKWPTSPLFLPVVHQMAADLLNLTGEGRIRFRSIGDERELPAAPKVNNVSRNLSTESLQSVTFQRPGFKTSGNTLFVVNGSAKESDPTRIESTAFADHYQIRLAESDEAETPESIEGEHRNELWPWLAVAAIALLTAEFSLANRTSA